MKRFLYWLFNILLIMGTLVTAMGLLYYQIPEAFEWFFEFMNITEGGRAYFTTVVGSTTVMGVGTKVLKSLVNTDNLKRDALHKLELDKISDLHNHEISLLKSDFKETVRVITESANEQINSNNIIIAQQDALLKERQANAKRMLEMSPNLVSDEVKQGYREFLDESEKIVDLELSENFYVENTEIIKIVEEPKIKEVEETHIPLSQRLNQENKEV